MRQNIVPHIFFIVFLTLNIGFWLYSKNIGKTWGNVPVAPSEFKININFLGDDQLAYRSYAFMLQSIGNVDGNTISLKKYDYTKLKDWFFIAHKLDPKSDIVPALAAYYFGAVLDPDKLDHVLDYLAVVGQNPEGDKWRWLGHAVYLARHQLEDNERALELAYLLADNKSPDLADWAKQMPVFILQDEGKSDLAYKIMLNLLISNAETLHPNELFFMREYICQTLLPTMPNTPRPEFCENF